MQQTSKEDWLTDKLSEKGLFVSSHSSLNKHLGFEEKNYDVSIRFIGNTALGYNFLLVIIVDDINEFKNNISSNITIFINKLSEKLNKQVYTVISMKSIECQKFLASSNGKKFNEYNSDLLKTFFENINQQYTKNVGTSKDINKSYNDNFQVWTRKNLSKYITINDFDAISIDTPTVYIIELKRVDEDINTWLPYLDEYANYKACESIIKDLNLDLNHFRTIGYNKKNENEIGVFIFTSIQQDRLKLFKTIVPVEELFKAQRYYESTNRRLKMKQL